ncbi:MAG TPA: WecB/TagA/CpsF family glycosyltransferase [Polyangiaceae bacterium]|nr:WecB/TagA/CpsF family glycosyltransferase [Polyangiaceae bacterium]
MQHYSWRRVRIGRLPIDAVTLEQAVDAIERLVNDRRGGTVYTPNVDHIMVAEENPVFRSAYEQVSLSLVDGTPVMWAARLLREPLPEKVSGSDLFDPLIARAAERGFRIYLLGGGPGVAELAATRLKERYPRLNIAGLDAPFIDGDGLARNRDEVLQRITAARPDIVLVACGAPKSELFCYHNFDELKPAVLVCVGAAIDFAAGTAQRAPRWVSRAGLEWLYRLSREPRRLAYRYLVRDPRFVGVVTRELFARKSGAGAASP